MSKTAFDRFVDYTTENERLAAAAEEEAAKLAALKKATYEMSKTWQDARAVRIFLLIQPNSQQKNDIQNSSKKNP